MSSSWHILHDGPPAEQVTYLGSSRWAWFSVDDLSGTELRARFSTRGMIQWVVDRDADDPQPAALPAHPTDEREHDLSCASLGVRGERLLAIARAEGADLCVRRLVAIRRGEWPPAPRIQEITGATRRVVWRGVFHAVYTARTTKGLAYVYPPQGSKIARVVLQGSSSSDEGWVIRLSRNNLNDMAKYQSLLQQLST